MAVSYVPGPIYRILPIVYIGAGVMTMAFVPHVIAFLSGVLLISAGLLVFIWRASARSRQKRSSRLRR